MGKTKSFKIGEYAIGGIIKVDLIGKVVKISALDWYTKKEIQTGTTLRYQQDAQRIIQTFLNDLTSSYYADKILDWIKSNTKLECEDEFYNSLI